MNLFIIFKNKKIINIKMSIASLIAFILSLILLIFVVVIYFLYFRHQGTITIHGIIFTIQAGKGGDASRDTMKTGGNYLYVGGTTSLYGLVLLISSSNNNKTGLVIGVKNTSKNKNIVIFSGKDIKIVGEDVATVYPGETMLFCAINDKNEFTTLSLKK